MRAHSGIGHAAWYVALAERARPELRAREARTWLERLDAEQANAAGGARAPARVRGRRRCAAAVGCDLAVLADTGSLDRGPALPAPRASRSAATLEPERLVNAFWGGAILALWQGDVDEGEQLATASWRSRRLRSCRGHVCGAIHLLAIAACSGEIATGRARCTRSRWRSLAAVATIGWSRSR